MPQTERTIQALDLTLIGMRDALLVAPRLAPDDPAYRAALNERLKSLPYVRSLLVVGADGFSTQDSGALHETSLADRPYFQAHQEDPDLGLHIGQPLRSLTTGYWFISLSRRIANADGSFGGVVVATIEPRYFKRFYENISIGEGHADRLASQGRHAARPHARPRRDHGRSYARSPVRKLAVELGGGITWTTSPVDRTARIVAYQTLAKESLIVMVGWPVRNIYDAWIEHAAVVDDGASFWCGCWPPC